MLTISAGSHTVGNAEGVSVNGYVLASYSITLGTLILYGIYLNQRRKNLSESRKSNSG